MALHITLAGPWAIIKVKGHQHLWLAGAYDLEIGHFWRWIARWLAGGYSGFFCFVNSHAILNASRLCISAAHIIYAVHVHMLFNTCFYTYFYTCLINKCVKYVMFSDVPAMYVFLTPL